MWQKDEEKWSPVIVQLEKGARTLAEKAKANAGSPDTNGTLGCTFKLH